MYSKFNRRHFLQGTAALAGFMQINPEFFITSAYAQSGKELKFLSSGPITGNWDPTSHTSIPQKDIEALVMGFLTRTPMRLDNPDQVVYELATEMKLLDVNRLQIKLRKGVVFHDGKPFKAEDVKATYEYWSLPDRPAQFIPGPMTVETPDDYTVIVDTTKGGYPAHLFLFLAAFLPMISSKDIAGGPKGVLTQRLNGTGPFKYVKQDGNDTVMAANEKYFRGKPAIPGIHFVFVGDPTTRLLSLLNGEASIVERLEPEQVASVQAKPDLMVHQVVSTENKYLWFRCSKEPFNNPELRMAVCHAIDRKAVLDVMGVAGHKSSNFISPVKFGYIDLANYPEYSPSKCQKLLAEAGFPKGKGLPALEFITSKGFYPKTQEYGELITQMLNEQGFNVTLSVLEPAAWAEKLFDRPGGGPGHMIDCGWATGSPEPDLVLRTLFHSSSHRICGIVDKDIDASLDRERDAKTLDERKHVLQTDTTPLLADKVPALSLFTSVLIFGLRKEFKDLYIYPDGTIDASKSAA